MRSKFNQIIKFNLEYPIVDGALSIKQYYEALDRCYQGWRTKSKNINDSTQVHQVKAGVFRRIDNFRTIDDFRKTVKI